ncbi:hypothetical protein HZB89_02465 [archaeon]|nr:hypothetical protein [archaeon]
MDAKQMVLAAIAFIAIAQVVHFLGAFIDMPYYFMPDYFSVWSKVMMPAAGPPPISFYITSVAFNFAAGLIFAWFFVKTKAVFKGAQFGLALFAVSTVPGTLALYLTINLPVMLLVSWAVQGLIVFTATGIAFSKIIK